MGMTLHLVRECEVPSDSCAGSCQDIGKTAWRQLNFQRETPLVFRHTLSASFSWHPLRPYYSRHPCSFLPTLSFHLVKVPFSHSSPQIPGNWILAHIIVHPNPESESMSLSLQVPLVSLALKTLEWRIDSYNQD